jgi:hypothetical protein
MNDRLPAAPISAWVRRQLERIEADHPNGDGYTLLGERLGVSETTVRNWADQVTTGGRENGKSRVPTDTFPRKTIEEALDHVGVPMWEVYPDLDDHGDQHDAYCPACHEQVTVGPDGRCPWCETETDPDVQAKLWCERCDRLVHPTRIGCWRCGHELKPIPWQPCDCDCGELIQRFDPHGRRKHYIRGHAPRSLERQRSLNAEPFAKYLEQRLKDLDLIGALAREHGIRREEIVAILSRTEPTVDRELVRRALWIASRSGTVGRGAPPRPGAAQFFDLYPDVQRAQTCPGCGRGKAPHAELCKQCRIQQDRLEGRKPPFAPVRIPDHVIETAYRAYVDEGLSIKATARRFFDQTPSKSVDSFANSLSNEWRKHGWAMRKRTPRRNAVAA